MAKPLQDVTSHSLGLRGVVLPGFLVNPQICIIAVQNNEFILDGAALVGVECMYELRVSF